MEIAKSVLLAVYLYSMFIYLKELITDIMEDKPKRLSDRFQYLALFIGGFVPILNTVVTYHIIKYHTK